MDKQTSDERLLKLIEGGAETKFKPTAGGGFKKPLAVLKPEKFGLNLLNAGRKALALNLPQLNKGLAGFAGLLVIIFIYILLSAPMVSKSSAAYFFPADAAAIAKIIVSGQEQGQARKSLSSQEIKRNIFLPSAERSGVYGQDYANTAADEIKDLKVVGIIWSEDPEVMIENTKDGRTTTLRPGEPLNEQLKVKKILRNSVILESSTESGAKEYEVR